MFGKCYRHKKSELTRSGCNGSKVHSFQTGFEVCTAAELLDLKWATMRKLLLSVSFFMKRMVLFSTNLCSQKNLFLRMKFFTTNVQNTEKKPNFLIPITGEWKRINLLSEKLGTPSEMRIPFSRTGKKPMLCVVWRPNCQQKIFPWHSSLFKAGSILNTKIHRQPKVVVNPMTFDTDTRLQLR